MPGSGGAAPSGESNSMSFAISRCRSRASFSALSLADRWASNRTASTKATTPMGRNTATNRASLRGHVDALMTYPPPDRGPNEYLEDVYMALWVGP